MLYKEKTEPTLSESLFRDPGCAYRGAPFWAWNCKLNKDVLLEQIEIFKQMGFGGYHMHPRVGLATPYLGEAFMEMIRACVDKAEKEDMRAYLYDEDRWPSGAAGGYVTKDKHLRGKYIRFSREKKECVSFEQMYEAEKPYLLATYDVTLDDAGALREAKQIADEADASGTVWYAYLIVCRDDSWYNNQAYLDTLDPDAVDTFLRVTLETYDREVGEAFGERVPSVFTDEPQYCRVRTLDTPQSGEATMPWTEKLDAYFTRCAGKPLTEALPEIVFDLPDGKFSALRYHYYNCIAQLFADSFSGRYGEWCAEHGIALTGHLMEEPRLRSQTCAVGDAMRSYPHFGIPGIDMLCDHREFTTAKQCQSMTHQCGKEGMLSELYGVTSWDYDFKHHKSQGDWQAALGVTLRVPHLSLVSMKGEAKRDYPASINYQSPWFREYGYVEDHFARVNTAMTRGKPDVHIAVVHPIESYWLLMGPTSVDCGAQARLENHFSDVTRWLLYDAADFDFLNEATLPELFAPTESGLQVGEMRYDAVLVPDCLTLRKTTLDILKSFADKGGKVIFAGGVPAYIDALPSGEALAFAEKAECIPFEKTEILRAVKPYKDVTITRGNGMPADELLCAMRRDTDGKWLFLAHGERLPDDAYLRAQELVLRIRGVYVPTLYDTVTGDICTIPYRIERGETVIERRFERTDSLLLHLAPTPDAPGLDAPQAEEKRSAPVDVAPIAAYRREEPNVLLLDRAAYALDDGDFSQQEEEMLRLDERCREMLGWPFSGKRMAQPWVIPDEPAEHTLTLRFRFASETDVDGARLALEDAPLCDVTLNGETVATKPDGWFTDKDIPTLLLPRIRKGENELLVRMPYTKRCSVEWCYILGEFDVRLEGSVRTIVPMTQTIGFSDVASQGLPFYGGNILYTSQIETPAGTLAIHLPHIGGALAKVRVDGRDAGVIALAPFTVRIDVQAGAHTLEIVCFGNRYNSFGPLHSFGEVRCVGPGAWRTGGDDWTYAYRLRPAGILSAPEIRIEYS